MKRFDLRAWPGFGRAGGPTDRHAWVQQVTTHSNAVSPQSLFVALKGSRTDGHQFVPEAIARGASWLLVRSDYSLVVPDHVVLLKVDDPLVALQEIATTYRASCVAKVVAITGSFGKTLTKDLLAKLLKPQFRVMRSPESFNSQLGVALSLLEIGQEDEIAIIEAGISRRGEMDRLATMIAPDHALLTTIGPAHLESIGGLEEIKKEKEGLLKAVPARGWVMGPSDCCCSCAAPYFPSERSNDGLPEVMRLAVSSFDYRLKFPDGATFDVKLTRGFPHLTTLLNQAVRAAFLLGARPDVIATSLQEYCPEPMRTEVWTSPLGVTFINDCYCADPLSVQRSLRMLKHSEHHKHLFVFGGLSSPRIGAYQAVYQSLQQCHSLDEVLLVEDAVREIPAVQEERRLVRYDSRSAALRRLRTLQRPGQTILIKGPSRQHLDSLRDELAEGIGETRLEVHMDAIRHNLMALRQSLSKETVFIPMVKADGYGIGAVALARFLLSCGIGMLGVAHVSEAIQLRLAGISSALFVFAANPHEVPQIVQWDLEVGVGDLEMVQRLHSEASANGRTVRVHLHVDTGMTRFGCRPQEAHSLVHAIRHSSPLVLNGCFSHLASAQDPRKDRETRKQIVQFTDLLRDLERTSGRVALKHIANSAGTLRFDIPDCNAVRIGLALFGLPTFPDSRLTVPLRPSLTLTSRLMAIHTCHRGDRVSYGGAFRIQRDGARVGVLPIGYFDGLRRSFSGKGSVIVRGQSVPIIGDICMDFCMVDLSEVPDARVNDSVLLFGQEESGVIQEASAFAAMGSLSTYELISGLGPRVQRLYVYDGESRDFL